MMKTQLAFLFLLTSGVFAFVPPSVSDHHGGRLHNCHREVGVATFAEKKKSPGGLDESMRNKLVTESIAPWRSVRLFLYGALGSGALIGGLITLSGALAAFSGARSDLDINTELLNLGIDFGAVAVFAVAAKFDLDKSAELDQQVEAKIERKKEQKAISKAMKEREKLLGSLKLDIQVSADGETKEAAVRELQAGAQQHLIIVAGPRKACRDALVGANLLKMDFAMSNVLVVPFQTDNFDEQARRSGGFGDRPVYEAQPYVARTTGDSDAWSDYINQELSDAVQQNGEKAKEEGIAIVVANNGQIIRRGVGKVPWRQMVEELEQTASSNAKTESLF